MHCIGLSRQINVSGRTGALEQFPGDGRAEDLIST